MAELNISSPQANETIVVSVSSNDKQINFNFDTSDAIFEKVDNNLEIYFSETDSTIVLEDFYLAYSSENMPDFLLASDLISSADFFAALDAALMPAAGNEDIAQLESENRRDNTDTNALATGISSLGSVSGGSDFSRSNAQLENITQQSKNKTSNEQEFESTFENQESTQTNTDTSLSDIPNEEGNSSGSDKVKVDIELDKGVEPGDKVEVKDENGNTLFDDIVTEDMIENGLNVEVPYEENQEEVKLEVTVTDKDDNSTTSSQIIDITPPEVELELDSITADDIINAAEANSNVTITGSVKGEFNVNDTVTLTVNNQTYTAKVNPDGSYSFEVKGSDLAADSNISVSITTKDAAGNQTTEQISKDYEVDTQAEATIKINDITEDNIINATESEGFVEVTGSVTGDYKAGDTVTLTVNNQTYTGKVSADGSYSIEVSGQDLAQAKGEISASITVTDNAGNTETAKDSHTVEVDTQAEATIKINDITEDNIINATESEGFVEVTGSVTGDYKAGDTVTLTVNNQTYTGKVSADGSYSIEVSGQDLAQAKGEISASITVTDNAGNTETAKDSHTVEVDTTASAEIVINNITADDVINSSEAQQNVLVSGYVKGDYVIGENITLTVNGQTYNGMLGTDGQFYIGVKGSDFAAANGEFSVSVEAKDNAGNTETITTTETITIDTSDLKEDGISVEILTGDNNNLNNTEISAEGTFDTKVTLGKDVELGDTITVNFGSQKQEITVDQDMLDNGEIIVSLEAPSAGFTGEIQVNATITDKAGNTGNASDDAQVTAPIAEVVDDFVSLNAGATATGNLLAGEDAALDGAKITSFEPAEGWSIQKWTSGEFVLTYNDNPDFKVVIQPDGSYVFTTPKYTHMMDQIDINSVLTYTIEDKNGNESQSTATFSSNATTEENLLIDGDFRDHTITITNVGSKDQNTYEYTTAGYQEGGQDSSEQELSALFMGSNDDKVEVTGTLAVGSDGTTHHIYGDELQNYTDAGNDTIIVGKVSSGGNIRADGNLYNDVVGGDDQVEIGTLEGTGIVTGDGWHLYSGSQGGNDNVDVENMKGGELTGDAYLLYDNAKGGDDTIEIENMTGGKVTGDAFTLYSTAVGGNDQIDITNMNGQSVYGDAYALHGKGGNDEVNIDTMNSGSVLGDGSIAYSTSQAGDDTITVKTLNNGNIYGDSNYEYAGAQSGSDNITVENMNGGNIYADGLYGTKDDGGNDTVTVNKFGNNKVTIDGGLGEDTFTYGSEEDAYIDFSGTNIKIDGTNATITNFENLNTGAGNDVIKISGETLDSVINTGEGFDLVYTDDASIKELLESNNISDAEILLTGNGIEGTSQAEIFEELGIAKEDGIISLDDSWTMTGSENGGTIFSNGQNEIWLNSDQDSSSADTGLGTLTWNSTDLLGGTDVVTNFQDGDKLDLTELKEAGYEVRASNGENGEGILTITDTAGDTAQTIIIPDVKFSDDEMRDADNIDFINM